MTTFLAQNAMDSASIPLQTENNCRFYEADYSMSKAQERSSPFREAPRLANTNTVMSPGWGPCSGTLFVRMTKRERPGMGSQRSLNKVPTPGPAHNKQASDKMNTPLRFITSTSLFDGHDAAINIMRRLIQQKAPKSSTSATTAASTTSSAPPSRKTPTPSPSPPTRAATTNTSATSSTASMTKASATSPSSAAVAAPSPRRNQGTRSLRRRTHLPPTTP